MSKNKVDYDCSKCPGYCCSYPRIVVTDRDIKRLAKHFGLSEDKAKTRVLPAAMSLSLTSPRRPSKSAS